MGLTSVCGVHSRASCRYSVGSLGGRIPVLRRDHDCVLLAIEEHVNNRSLMNSYAYKQLLKGTSGQQCTHFTNIDVVRKPISWARAFLLVLQRPHVLYQLAEHGNFGDTFIDRGEEIFLARHGIEPAAECSLSQVGF